MNASTIRAGCLLGMIIAVLGFALPVHPPTVASSDPEDVTVEIASTGVENKDVSTVYAMIRFTNHKIKPIWIMTPLDALNKLFEWQREASS